MMRRLNVISALLIMGCAVYLSVHHTHDLYRSVGFSDKHAWVAVLMAEVMFLVGGVNVAVARFRSYKPGWPAYTGFFLGLGLVGWSNIASTAEYGLAGWLLGGSIVAVVLIMEMIMTHAVKEKVANQTINQSTNKPADEQPASQPEKQGESTNNDQAADKSTKRPKEEANQINNQPTESTTQPDSGQVVESQTTKKINQQELTDQPTTQPTQKNVIQFSKRPANRSAKKSTSQPSSSTDQQKIKEIAWNYFNQHKEWPSQRKLASLAGTTRHQAIKALAEVEKEMSAASASK